MSKILKNVLIGTTLSEGSDEIVRTGLALARASGATPHLVHAMPPLPAYTGFPTEIHTGADEAWLEAGKRDLDEKLAAQARRTGLLGEGLAGVLHFEPGAPHRVLEVLAATLEADLIVVGAAERGRRPLGLGSTADRILRRAPCPVLVLRPGVPFPPRRALVPLDLSPFSAGTLRYGLGFLAEAAGELPPVEAVFVLGPGESTDHFSPEQIARFAATELHRFVEKSAPYAARWVDCRVRSGYPAEQIVQEIEARSPDLAILGTGEKSGLERLLLGSVASGVLREAACNTLIVPAEAALLKNQEAEALASRGADWAFVSDQEPASAGVRR